MTEQATRGHPESYLRLGEKIAALRGRGICYQCHDLATGEVFPEQPVIHDDERLRVVLDQHPRAHGHTIVVWKPHRNDFTELAPEETTELFAACTTVANAIQRVLGAEKVYLVTMCDGTPNHLHVQLLPRYPGESIGSKRLVAPRQLLVDGDELAAAIRAELPL
ncbi:MAG: HIT family protein [Chloroflexota bacterium]|nr:HIT family protein [Chloroflexota bacterium]